MPVSGSFARYADAVWCSRLGAETPLPFDACLAESGVSDVPLTARLYLDVCFFHPFHDGNGRAALAMATGRRGQNDTVQQ